MLTMPGKIWWIIASAVLLFSRPVLGDIPKDPSKDPMKQKEKDVPTDKLSGELAVGKSTSQPARTTTRPHAKASPSTLDERALFFARLRWASLSRYSSAANNLLLLDIVPLLKRYPQDHTLIFYHALLSMLDGHTHHMETFCSSTTPRPPFYRVYCNAWSHGQVSNYNTLTVATALSWIKQLTLLYKNNPKDRDLRYHIIDFYISHSYTLKRTPYKTLVLELLKDDLQEHPGDVWVQAYALGARISTLSRKRSELMFLLPSVQDLAKNHPNHVIAQMLVWFVARRLYARSLQKTTEARLEALTQGNDLWSQFHRHVYLSSNRDDTALLAHMENLIDRTPPHPKQGVQYANFLSRMATSLSWRLRKKAGPLYLRLVKRYPTHARILTLVGYHHERAQQKELATQLYQRAVPLVDDDRTLQDLYWKLSYKNRPLALQLLNQYLQRYPGHVWALSRRANLYKQLQEKDKAEQDYQSLLSHKKTLSAAIYSELARHYQYDNNYPQAINICNIALNKHPQAAELYALRAEIHKNLNKHSEAIADYLKAFQLLPTSTWYGRSYATLLLEQGQTEKALAFLKTQAQQKTESANAWKKIWIEFLYKAGKTGEAQAVAVQSGNAESLMTSGRNLAQKNQHTQAITMFRAALLKTNSLYTRKSLYREIAESYKSLGQFEKAEESYRHLIDLDPNYYYSYYTLSSFYLYKSKQPQKAITLWGEYLQRKPTDSNGYYQRADVYRQTKDNLAALLNYLQGFEKSKKSRWDYERIANFLSWTLRRKDLALSIWNEYLTKYPKDANGYRQRASILMQNKKFQAAEKDYRKAIELAPTDLYTYSSLGNLYIYQLKQPEKALEMWTLYLQQRPKDARALRYRAELYRRQKDYPKAIADLEASLHLDSNNQYAYSPLASLYSYELKNYAKAREVWTKFIVMRGYLSAGYIERAKLWAQEKSWAQALTDWQAAETREQWSWRRREIWQGMALCYRHLGQYDLAAQKLRKAIASTTSSYALRSLWKDLAFTYEAQGDYKAAQQALNSLPPSSWDRSPHWMKIRFLVGAGQLDQALALALSSCSGPQQMPSKHHRKQACQQHRWLEYYTRLLLWPISPQAFTHPAIPPAHKQTTPNAFQNILRFLLRTKGTQKIVQPRKK